MNLVSIKYFIALAKELHMTNTAHKLYVSQQNLTQHIKRIEEYYDIILFDRKPKLSLTYTGEIFYEHAKKIVNQENLMINELNNISNNGLGKLRIGIPSYRAQTCLPIILKEFYKKWPNIYIETYDHNSEKLEDMLFSNELDIFIGIMPNDNIKLEVIPLLNDKIFLVASDLLLKKYFGTSYLDLKKEFSNGVNVNSFSKVPFLLPKLPSRLRNSIDNCFRLANIKPKIFFEAMTTDMLIPFYPEEYGAFFCTQTRLVFLRNIFKNVNAFPVFSNNELVYHRLVLAHNNNQSFYSYILDFINITKDVFKSIDQNRI